MTLQAKLIYSASSYVVVKYFEEHEYMQRRDFEACCECSRYTATKKLKALVRAGKLRAMGAKNVRFYVRGTLGQ